MNLLLDTLAAAPLFAALLLQSTELDPLVLRNFLNLSLLLLAWSALRRVIPWFLKREGSAIWRTIALTFSSLGVIAALEMTRLRLPSDLVGLALFILGSLALEQALRQRQQYWWAFAAFFASSGALGILGFQIVGESVRWQPVVFTLALALSALCTELARRIEQLHPQAYAAKAFAAAFVISPTLVAFLAYTNQLPIYYLASYAILLLAPLTVTPILRGASPAPIKALFVFPLFIGILLLLRVTFGSMS